MWYKSPIRPFDPVIDLDPATGATRYIRDSFTGTGQVSQILAPATPQDQFSVMQNVMPPVRGVVEKRWGYAPFISTLPYVPSHLELYANEAGNPPTRKILAMAPGQAIAAFNEDGTPYDADVLTMTGPPLSVYSRSTQYFFDGQTLSQKWNGASAAGTSNTGIDINNATGTTSNVNVTSLALAETSLSDAGGAHAWSSGGGAASFGINATDGVTVVTNQLNAEAFGFALPGGAPVNTVSMSATFAYTDNDPASGDIFNMMYFQMLKAGVPYGPIQSFPMVRGTGMVATAFWNLASLGLTLTDVDVNASNFGVAVWCNLFWYDPLNASAWRKQVGFNSGAITLTLNYNATTTSNSITISGTSAGNVTLTSGRIYYVVFRNSTTAHMSDLSLPSLSTGAVTAQEINLTGIPQSLDPQVDVKWLLATADAGDETLLYFLAELPNATGSYTDDTDELTLLAGNIVQETDSNGDNIGVADNTPPPVAGYLPIKHQGRLFLANGGTLYCSKNLQELTTSTGLICGRYEESWPTTNQFDISDDAELIRALVSDGTTLYVCTNRHIRKVTGDSPADFSLTQIALNEAGVANHEAITVVYAAGSPAGAVWVTPDNRVVLSDFNTYQDIGAPIQNVLNLSNNPLNTRVTFYSNGAYDICVVALTTGNNLTFAADTWAIYDTRGQTWAVWNLSARTNALLFLINQSGIPIWLFADNSHVIHQLASTFTTDNGSAISSTLTTAMMHLGSPTSRKYLNEVELITADANLHVSVLGADTASELATPNILIANAVPVVSPLGPYKVFTAHVSSKYRYYQLSFTSTGVLSGPMLEAYNIESIPIHQL